MSEQLSVTAPGSHPMMPGTNHDEAAEQLFIRDLKSWVGQDLESHIAQMAAAADPGPTSNDRAGETYRALLGDPAFHGYASLRRTTQELMWDDVGRSVARQAPALDALAAAAPAGGSITLDPYFTLPEYLADRDVHLMPGGYDPAASGVTQGALMDRGGAVYMLGRNGGLLNDRRGHTAMAHLLARWPDAAPRDILELGCGTGSSTVPAAEAFPEAAIHGLDVGASMLRYAHARASWLGHAIHFTQGSAECAPYPDASFDVVYSCVLMHETSPAAMTAILAECLRLLRPGGVAIHLEVPQRYDDISLWGQVRGAIEYDYNNEPNWRAAISLDFAGAMTAAGFADVATGFQDATSLAERGNHGFGGESKGVFGSWFVASGRRPAP